MERGAEGGVGTGVESSRPTFSIGSSYQERDEDGMTHQTKLHSTEEMMINNERKTPTSAENDAFNAAHKKVGDDCTWREGIL